MTTKPKAWIECQDCKLCPNCLAAGRYRLTRQELVVTRLLCCGTSTADIVRSLHITEETLKRHLSNIFDKLGMDNRVQLVVFALAKGLATLDYTLE